MHVPLAQQRCLQHPAKPLEYTTTVYPPRTPPPTVYTREQLLSVKPSPLDPVRTFSPASFADWFRPTPVPRPQRKKAKTEGDRAMYTFSLVASLSANGMKLCVCVCVCGRNELKYALRWHIHKSVHSVLYASAIHKHTRILKPFEDSEPTGLRSPSSTTPRTDLALFQG